MSYNLLVMGKGTNWCQYGAAVAVFGKIGVDSDKSSWIWGATRFFAGLRLAATAAETKGKVNVLNMYRRGIRGGVYGNCQLAGRNYYLFNSALVSKASRPIYKLPTIGKKGWDNYSRFGN